MLINSMAVASGVVSWGESVHNNFTNSNYDTLESFYASFCDIGYYSVSGIVKYAAGSALGRLAVNIGISLAATLAIKLPIIYKAGITVGLAIAAGSLTAMIIAAAGAVVIYYIGEGIDYIYENIKKWLFE